MAVYQIFKETALPGTLEAHSIYLIAPPSAPDFVEMYVTGAAATTVKRIINESDVQAMITSAMAGASTAAVVADIAARDALTPSNGMQAFVRDATGDPTVNSGAATYLYDASVPEWVKINEYESLDLSFDWSNIQNGPSSSPAAIDAAVAASHTHANKTQLDKIGEDGSGNLTYNGSLPKIAWDSTGW